MLENIISGFSGIFTIQGILFMNIGMFAGIIIGAIPGLNANIGIVLALPFTFGMDPITGISMLVAVFCGCNFGGSITAILIRTPGTNSAAATVLDGAPLAEKGYPRKALEMALIASTVGGIISGFALLFLSPQIAKIGLLFGPPEYFALAIFGLSIIAALSGDSIPKGVISGCLGILLATVGVDSITGTMRFIFGNYKLMSGVALVPVLFGLFALTRIFELLNSKDEEAERIEKLKGIKDDKLTLAEVRQQTPNMVFSGVLGVIIGAIPGAGTAIAAFLGYNEAKSKSKHPEKFGTGVLEGIAAPEAANNGAAAATLIPLITLGIPGGSVAATLLGAFMMHGLIPGPSMFTEQAGIIYAIMLSALICNAFMFLQGKFLMPAFKNVSRIPAPLMTVFIIIMVMAGGFAYSNNPFSLNIIIVSGIVAYLINKIGINGVPLLLGLILGPIMESNFRNALSMSDGSFTIFITRPISLVFIVLAVVLIVSLRRKLGKSKKKENVTA